MKPTAFLLLSLVPLLLAAFILWLGAPMMVRCDHIFPAREEQGPALEREDASAAEQSRVDVTMHRKILGLLPVKRATVIDVVGGHSYVQSSRGRSRGRGGDTGTVLSLELRDGRNWNSPGNYSPIGTPPGEMATRIKEFIKTPSASPLRMWCVSWVAHLVGLPVLFIGLLFAYAGLNVLRKNLAEHRSPNAAYTG